MQKLINIPHALTADMFGCDADHFRKHIRGRQLPVLTETQSFYTIVDATGESWTVNKKDINYKQEEQ